MRLTFFILVIVIPLCLNGQSVELIYQEDNKSTCKCNSTPADTIQTTISLNSTEDERYLACCYHCMGVWHYRENEYIKAIQYYKKAIALRIKHNDNQLGKSYKNMGYSQKELGSFHKAIVSINNAFQIDDAQKNNPNNYRYLGYSYTAIGEFENARKSLNQASKLATSNIDKAELNNTYCNFHLQNGTYPKAVECAEEAIKLFDTISHFDGLGRAYNNKGNAQRFLAQYDEAIKSYKEAADIHPKKGKPLKHAKTVNNIAAALYEQKKYEQAITTLNLSLQLKKKYYKNAPFKYTYAANYENLAENYDALGNVEKALEYYQLALQNLTDNFRNKDINTNPKASDNHHIYDKPDLLRVLDLKGQTAMRNDSIDLAYRTYIDLDNWINEFYKDLCTKESKLTWIERAHDTYAHAIEVAMAKNDEEKAFEYAEKAHAVLLWQSLSQKAAQSLLSEDDKEKIDELATKIRQAEQDYDKGKIKIGSLRGLEYEREVLEKTLEDKLPEYARRKYQPEATTVSEIQSKIIDDQTAFIEYYRTGDVLYIFTITKKGLEITQRKVDGLAEEIIDFVKNISLQDMDLETYHASAYKLYEQLIPSSIRSNNNINSLIIVPDREIGKLPFAALATEVCSGKLNKNTPFLVKKYTTNYLYSAGSYLQLQKKKADQRYCFAGIAPMEYQMEDWKKLPHAKLDEMKSLHWSWQREILTKETATKAAFERIINGQYRTIQVSTHALFDKNKGQIVFYDSVLNQDEIDELKINTHRLILSACETGVGVENQGEGILSLGWNFAYKGVPSITMTHWKIDDYSSHMIMVSYHENLNDGTAADNALREAQLSYLNSDIITINSDFSPYYWAAFFHTGNTRQT